MALGNNLAPIPLTRQETIYIPDRLVYRFNPFGDEDFYDTIPFTEFIVECETNRELWEQRMYREMPRVDPVNVNPFEMERLLQYTASNWVDGIFTSSDPDPPAPAVTMTPPPPIRRETPPRAPERLGRRIRREVCTEVVRELTYDEYDESVILDFEHTDRSTNTISLIEISSPPRLRDRMPPGGSPISS